MKSLEGIKKSKNLSEDHIIIARKIYLSYPTHVFSNLEDDEFYIKNRICEEFKIPFSSIQICGSGKTGISFYKDKIFIAGVSDLDISIISLPLYNLIVESSHMTTNGFTNLTSFIRFKGERTDRQFISNLSKGYINPFFMPSCDLKTKWFNFFEGISNKYFKLFKSINAGVYASEYFFEYKQKDSIEQYLTNEDKYDKISNSI